MNTFRTKLQTGNAAPLGMFTDVHETFADWFEIRVTEMSGFDYVFAPMDICDQITDFLTLQDFLINVQALLGSEPGRTILIGVERNPEGDLAFDRFDAEWSNEMVIDCRRSSLSGTTQFEFIEMLFEYSDRLMAD